MSIAKAMDFIPTQINTRPSKEGIRIITEMPSRRIVGYLAYRHRVGLLTTSTILLVSYIAWDKFLHIFF